jgi:prevent-host-death family protein
MPVEMDVRDFQGHVTEVLDRVRAGEEIVLAQAGRPIARLSPAPERLFGEFKGRVEMADDFLAPLSDEELAEWEQ